MPTTQTADPTAAVLTNALDTPKRTIYAALSELCGVPVSSLCDRAHGSAVEKRESSQAAVPL